MVSSVLFAVYNWGGGGGGHGQLCSKLDSDDSPTAASQKNPIKSASYSLQYSFSVASNPLTT